MEDEYKTISDNVIGEGYFTNKRSKFLAFAHYVPSVEEADNIIAQYRKRFHDARHCCYAYVIGPDKHLYRANDDGEPSSTAGKPILGQIHSLDLTDVLVVVVRYYGGVNLGTGGLIEAYRTAASEALGHCRIVTKQIEETITYNFAYPSINAVMRIVKEMNPKVIARDFGASCSITLSIRKSKAEELRGRLKQISFE